MWSCPLVSASSTSATAKALWTAGQWLSLGALYPPFMSQGFAKFFQGCWCQESWFSARLPVSLSHSCITTSHALRAGVSLPGASLKPSPISRALEAPRHLLLMSIEPLLPRQERSSWLSSCERLQGRAACLEGEKPFPQVCSYWGSHEGGIFNLFFF